MTWHSGRSRPPERAPGELHVGDSDSETALRAQTLWQLGRPEAALSLLEPAIASSPESVVLLRVAATVYSRLERYEEAVAAARRAAALNPEMARPHMRLANILNSANRPQEARQPALTALRLDPDQPGVYATASETLRRCGELDQAHELAERAMEANPERHPALLGRVLLAQGRWEEAEAYLRRAAAANPDFWDPALYLALSLVPQGRGREAQEALRGYLARHPDDRTLPWLWERLEEWFADEDRLRQQVSAGIETVRSQLELGALYLRQDRAEEAARALTAARAAKLPNDADRARLDSLEKQLQSCEKRTASEPSAMAVLEQEMHDDLSVENPDSVSRACVPETRSGACSLRCADGF